MPQGLGIQATGTTRSSPFMSYPFGFMEPLGPYTVSFWYYPLETGIQQAFLDFTGSSTWLTTFMQYNWSGRGQTLLISTNTTGDNKYRAFDNVFDNTNAWVHVVCGDAGAPGSLSPADFFCYVDGVEETSYASQTGTGTVETGGNGYLDVGYDTDIEFRIAHIGIWNRVLTYGELSQLRNKSPLFFPDKLKFYDWMSPPEFKNRVPGERSGQAPIWNSSWISYGNFLPKVEQPRKTYWLPTAAIPHTTGEILNIDFEGGDKSEFDSETNGTYMSVNSSGPIEGTYDLAIDCTSAAGADAHGNNNLTIQRNVLRGRFKIDISSLSMTSGDLFYPVWLNTSYSGSSRVGYISINYTGSVYHVTLGAQDDNDTSRTTSSSDTNADITGEHTIEFAIYRETTDGAADGYQQLWVDGTLISGTDTDIQNFNTFHYLSGTQLGADSLDAGTTGTLYLDGFIIRDDNTEIGQDLGTDIVVDNLSQSNTVTKPTLEPWYSFDDGFETGDVSEWDGSNNSPTINGTAAIDGSYGMQIAYSESNTYAYIEQTNTTQQVMTVKFKIDMNDLGANDNQFLSVVMLRDDTTQIAQIRPYRWSGAWYLQTPMRQDNDSWVNGNGYTISGVKTVEVEFDFLNGESKVWINNSYKGVGNTGIDTDTRFPDEARFGNTLVTANSGGVYLDSFEYYWGERQTGGDLTVDDLSQSTTVDKVGITKESALAVDDLSSANTVEHIDLVQQLALTIDSLSQSNAVDKFSITQLHNLQVEDLSQSSTVTKPLLEAEGYLAVYSLSQSNTVDHITTTKQSDIDAYDLSQSTTVTKITFSGGLVNLTVDNLSQSTTLDKLGVLTQYATVYPRTLTNTQTVGHISLTQQHVIQDVADLSQDTAVDKVAVWANNNVDVKNLSNTNTATKISMTQVHVLVIPGAYVNTTVDNVGLWDWWYEIVEGVGLVTQAPDVVGYITRSHEGYGFIRQTEEQDGLIVQTLEEEGSIVQTYDVEGEIVREYEGIGEI